MIIRRKNIAVKAADDDEFDFGEPDMEESEDIVEDDDGFNDTLDSIADDIEDLKDDVDEVDEDEVGIELDNNIDGHYIAECSKCHGIFISAVSQTSQVVSSIQGVCPLCDKESDQYLKWVIKAL